jgi:YVTN family beta-propeller protein
MLALYRSGRQAEALESYRSGRSLLVGELAVEPSPQLRHLERAILQQDTALDLGSDLERTDTATALATAPPATEQPPTFEQRRDRRPGRARVALALAVAAGVLIALVLVPQLGSSARRRRLDGNLLALVSPGDGAVTATVALAAPPSDLVFGFGTLWVTEPATGVVVRVDPQRRAPTATIPVGTSPSRLLVADGQVWVLDRADGTVSRIDPTTDTVAQTILVGGDPSDLVLRAGSLWVASRHNGTVTRIDPLTGRTQQVVRTGGDPSGLAAAAGAVWVADDQAGTVARIDPFTGAVTNKVRIGDAPSALAATAGGVWVLDPLDATVSRIDPEHAAVAATIPLGGAPASLIQAGDRVWVSDPLHGTLEGIDPLRGVLASTISLAGRPAALAAAGSGLWVAEDAGGADHFGGTLRTVSSYEVIDTIDPAASTSPNVSPPQLFGLTNDGLVTFDHVAGPDGARLIPDLALALPAPGDSGRKYTFQLRPGIRYSTGALLQPSDVTRSFERLFAIGSSGVSYYETITGAAACLRAPSSCNLSRGIVADNRTGTISFHLTRPDPDFLYKLTLAYADVLPGSTPRRQARAPLPATGPYMIVRYLPGQQLELVRNPRFREWSTAAQPDGYPNRIVISLSLDPAHGAAAIADGEDDFMANLGQISAAEAAYFLVHRRQVRVNPTMVTAFMFLNVRATPFNDIRVRRALNLALDRRAIVSSYGGPLTAQPTCQILPPGLPGYRPYCPYTRHPTIDGTWHGTDLAAAKRLVAATHTAGMMITVWNSPNPAAAVAETHAAVDALNRLGYRATLRLLPDTTYFTYTNDSRNRAQVIDGGWSADYPTADDFIGKLTCPYFTPANGPATTDASEFCNPAIDRQVAGAASLQTIDPSAADALWTRLDHELTDLAIWLPTVTPNETDLISRRAGNYEYNPVWGPLLDQIWVR